MGPRPNCLHFYVHRGLFRTLSYAISPAGISLEFISEQASVDGILSEASLYKNSGYITASLVWGNNYGNAWQLQLQPSLKR